jgi:hypothetical protein
MVLGRLLTPASRSYRSSRVAVREIEIDGRLHRIDGCSVSTRSVDYVYSLFCNGIGLWSSRAGANRTWGHRKLLERFPLWPP